VFWYLERTVHLLAVGSSDRRTEPAVSDDYDDDGDYQYFFAFSFLSFFLCFPLYFLSFVIFDSGLSLFFLRIFLSYFPFHFKCVRFVPLGL
jgi:hypothetical protein